MRECKQRAVCSRKLLVACSTVPSTSGVGTIKVVIEAVEPKVTEVDSEAGKKFKPKDILNSVGILFWWSHLFCIFVFEGRKVYTVAQSGIKLFPLVIAVWRKKDLL
jgi:hypothetical protein